MILKLLRQQTFPILSSMHRNLYFATYNKNSFYKQSEREGPVLQRSRERSQFRGNKNVERGVDTSLQTHFKQENIKNIDQVNKFFQGVRINTKYAKFNNEDSFKNIERYNGVRKIGDLPFQGQPLSKLQAQLQQTRSTGQPDVSNPKQSLYLSPTARQIMKKVPREQLQSKLRKMAASYFTDLINNERTVKIQPNFEREARRTMHCLRKAGYQFAVEQRSKQDGGEKGENDGNAENAEGQNKGKFRIVGVEVFKGLEVIRNNNYSIDSFEIIQQKGYKYYKLWQRGSYKIPQQQWNNQFKLLLRITTHQESPHTVTITPPQGRKSTACGPSLHHTFTFEADLVKPPRFAQFSLSPAQYLAAYDFVIGNLWVTNVDGRNPYAGFMYEEKMKREGLINRFV